MINETIVPIFSLIVVFLFSVHKFTDHIQRIAGDRFKSLLHSFTSTPLRGFGLGVFFTSLIQSSTATTVILVSLVHAGFLSFRNSLGVVFGANIGTTVTSQLVALNVGNIAPYFIIIGFFIFSFSKWKYKEMGKAIFYFGLMFSSLFLISLYLDPVRENKEIIGMLSHISGFLPAVLVGFLFTAIVQSSSIVSSVVILLVGNGFIGFDQAFGMIIGANIGTTITAFIASLFMNEEAKKVAYAHILFNVFGFLLFFPFGGFVSQTIKMLGGSVSQQVANAHLFFNLICGVIFLIFVHPFEKFIHFLGNMLIPKKK